MSKAARLLGAFITASKSPGPPVDDKTLYNVASLTKPITAEVILRLASNDRLSLDEPMAPFWTDPDIKDNPWSRLLTPRICLSHQTGFTNWRYQTKGVLTFQWQPGAKTGYSGEGFDYVARFAEKKTGQPWAQRYVFDEIGMHDTFTRRAIGGPVGRPNPGNPAIARNGLPPTCYAPPSPTTRN